MARQRKYADPISIPFEWDTKDRIVALADEFDVAQADVVRDSMAFGLDAYEKRMRAAREPKTE